MLHVGQHLAQACPVKRVATAKAPPGAIVEGAILLTAQRAFGPAASHHYRKAAREVVRLDLRMESLRRLLRCASADSWWTNVAGRLRLLREVVLCVVRRPLHAALEKAQHKGQA